MPTRWMTSPRRASWIRWVFALPLLALCGCQSLLQEGTADAAGVGGAALATAVTDNGAVATGIGLGVRSAARAGLNYGFRRAQHAEQRAIATAAGPLAIGQIGSWKVSHDAPILPDAQGKVTVVRDIGLVDVPCREIVFSVDGMDRRGPKPSYFTATICRNQGGWGWASAEPATERWGALQ
ncbi:hypothetical protein IAI18_14940 [Acetobacteraceae bacterium H6797]|nr:hypothetical protein [Acetobacteraceae bacterium H6797]